MSGMAEVIHKVRWVDGIKDGALCSDEAIAAALTAAGFGSVKPLQAQIERVEALAETWRYKGEFGWGAWQEGYGPDETGAALDQASSAIRAALTATEGA